MKKMLALVFGLLVLTGVAFGEAKVKNTLIGELEGARYYELMIFSERANYEATLREYAEKELQLKYMATVNLNTLDFPENAKVSAWLLISAKTNMCIMQDKQILFVYVTPDDKVNALVYCYGD